MNIRDIERTEKFLFTYNQVDAILRERLNIGRQKSFWEVIAEFEKQAGAREDVEILRTAANLRNILVHDPKKRDDLPAIPTPRMLSCLDRICQDLTAPELVVPRFNVQVETVSPNDTLAHVLAIIARRDYSQFPVYAGGRFLGLVTENGITRWLARHVSHTLTLVELEDVFVREVLRAEEARRNAAFVAVTTETNAVRKMFADQQLLEAVLVTQNGNRSETPTGIITRWDILR